MAFAKLTMEHPLSGKIKHAPVGFSWTSFFFTVFVPLLRGHFLAFLGWFAAGLGVSLLTGLLIGVSPFEYYSNPNPSSADGLYILLSLGFNLLMGFLYNKQYLQHLIRKGFKSTNHPDTIQTIERKLEIEVPVLAPSGATSGITEPVSIAKPDKPDPVDY